MYLETEPKLYILQLITNMYFKVNVKNKMVSDKKSSFSDVLISFSAFAYIYSYAGILLSVTLLRGYAFNLFYKCI